MSDFLIDQYWKSAVLEDVGVVILRRAWTAGYFPAVCAVYPPLDLYHRPKACWQGKSRMRQEKQIGIGYVKNNRIDYLFIPIIIRTGDYPKFSAEGLLEQDEIGI